MVLISLLLMCITLLVVFIVHRTNSAMNYWHYRGIPYLKPELLFGNTKDMIFLRTTIFECYQTLYHKLEGHRFGGFFQMGTPYLMIRDPNLIKRVLVDDFDHFHDRGLRFNKKADPLSEHIFLLGGQQWRALRNVLNPAFTCDNIKKMFFLMEDCSKRMVESLKEQAEYMENIDLKEISARFSADVIAACGFGIDCNSIGNPQSVFIEIGSKIFEPTITAALKTLIIFTMPLLADLFGISFISNDVNEFFKWLSKETIKYRKDNNVKRSDFIHLLMKIRDEGKIPEDNNNNTNHKNKAKNSTEKDFEFTDNVFAAQLLIMFLAGLEMISSVMSFCLYELAVNPEIQTKLRVEIDSSLRKHGSKLDYESVEDMPYMDMVISETLRMYPPVGMFLRECTKPYRIPDTNVTIERGTRVCVPIYALHKDPQYFPRPQLFNPERFSAEHPAAQHPFTYLPFGDGPRICIGMRFALAEMKVGLSALLSQYEFSRSSKTVIPPRFNPTRAIPSSVEVPIVRISRRSWLRGD